GRHDGAVDARVRWHAHGQQPRYQRCRSVGLLSRSGESWGPWRFSDGHERRAQPDAYSAGAGVADGRTPGRELEDDRKIINEPGSIRSPGGGEPGAHGVWILSKEEPYREPQDSAAASTC